ncbi:MAG: PHP domain-containing protein [Acidaminococcaceae bacterium]
MNKWLADLHVHTLLSPCAEIEMTPHHIVMKAAEIGVNLLAITDHNTSANIAAAMEAGERYGVKILPGMEVQCKEEAHIIVLFDALEQIECWQRIVDKNMLPLHNDPNRFGAQFIVDADDNFVAEEPRMLLASLQLEADEIIDYCNNLGGICIAAHIDRPSYSLLGQLGFLTKSMALAAVEISPIGLEELTKKSLKPLVSCLPYLTSSDAHRMIEFLTGPKTAFCLEKPSVAEIKLALGGEKGRNFLPGCFIKV